MLEDMETMGTDVEWMSKISSHLRDMLDEALASAKAAESAGE